MNERKLSIEDFEVIEPDDIIVYGDAEDTNCTCGDYNCIHMEAARAYCLAQGQDLGGRGYVGVGQILLIREKNPSEH